MPRCVRNFWVEAETGTKTPLKGGPRKKDEGMEVTISMRENGYAEEVLSIEGLVSKDGKTLTLEILSANPRRFPFDPITIKTKR